MSANVSPNASPVDVACSLPANATYDYQLFAKSGRDNDGLNWKSCDTKPPYLCPGVDASWAWGGEIREQGGRFAVQAQLVPFYAANFRGRLVVSYQVR